MSRCLSRTFFFSYAICLVFPIIASSIGPETPTASLDEIKSAVSGSLDLGNANV